MTGWTCSEEMLCDGMCGLAGDTGRERGMCAGDGVVRVSSTDL